MSHSSKTWDLAERSRKVSKGQAKIFLTRSAGEEQRLAKLTQHLDKEKAARESQLSYAQKLLVKRYGVGKVGEGGGSESRWSSRDRSRTCDPTFTTRAYNYEEKDTCTEITGRARAASGSSCDLDDRKSSGNCRELSDIPRVHSQGNVSTAKDKDGVEGVSARRKISFNVEDLLRNRQTNCSGSDGEIYKNPNRSPVGTLKIDYVDQERRPRAVSEILPPISLPPIFKVDEKMTGKMNSGNTVGLVTGARKTSVPGKVPRQAYSGTTRKTPKDVSSNITDEKTMNYELGDCRYLRTRNLED